MTAATVTVISDANVSECERRVKAHQDAADLARALQV